MALRPDSHIKKLPWTEPVTGKPVAYHQSGGNTGGTASETSRKRYGISLTQSKTGHFRSGITAKITDSGVYKIAFIGRYGFIAPDTWIDTAVGLDQRAPLRLPSGIDLYLVVKGQRDTRRIKARSHVCAGCGNSDFKHNTSPDISGKELKERPDRA